MDPVEIRKSAVRGNGLFATQNIDIGEDITIIPEHMRRYYDGEWKIAMSSTFYIYRESFPEWFVGENVALFNQYLFRLDDRNWIWAMPDVLKPGFLGHICNDGAMSLGEYDQRLYEVESGEKRNVKVVEKCGYVYLVATRNIKRGEELFLTYGLEFWKLFYK